MRRRKEPAEPPLVHDLLERLRAYEVGGVICQGCLKWSSLDAAREEGWWTIGQRLYCPACGARELGPTTH